MRIISKFHDFYDVVMKQGMDREVVYVRETQKLKVVADSFGIDFTTSSSGNHYSASLLFLGYCGQVIKVIDLNYNVKDASQVNGYSTMRRVFFDFEEFKAFMLENKYGSKYDFDTSRWWPSGLQKFNNFDTGPLNVLFHEHQVPLFILTNTHRWRERDTPNLELNPSLKKLDFHKFKDPYTTYQDIFQYVAGVLNRPENNMVTISDKDKIHKHGFDKWSFRKMPTKKK